MGYVEQGGGYKPQPFQEKFDAGGQGGNTSGRESSKQRKARAKRFLVELDKPAKKRKKKRENQPTSDEKNTGKHWSGFGGHGPDLPESYYEEQEEIRRQLIEQERIHDQLLQGNSDQSDDSPGPNKSFAK